MIIELISVFVIGVSLGGYLQNKLTKRAIRLENEKAMDSKNAQFVEVLKSLKGGGSVFKSRVNDMVYIKLNLQQHGDIDLIYLIDKNDIAIFQQTKCLYTSDNIDKELINQIIHTIFKIYGKKINDTVEILGFVFYREEFEKSFNIKVEDLKKSNFLSSMQPEVNEIDKINSENQIKFDIDDILDKISEFGITSLSIEERLFLDNYSNEKRN